MRATGRRSRATPRTRSTQKLPIVTDAACEAADQCDRDGDADGGRDEVLHREAGELHGVAQGELGRVRLPVRVRHERRRGVEREAFRDGGQAERVREHRLEPLQCVDEAAPP